jgi:hypothetical protein
MKDLGSVISLAQPIRTLVSFVGNTNVISWERDLATPVWNLIR